MQKIVFDKYIISSEGALFSLKSNKFIKLIITHKGYGRYHIYTKGRSNYYSAHKLVAESFIKNPENKPQINHINGIKTDNRVENLEWCTPSENQKHSFNILGNKSSNFGKFGKNNHLSKPINKYSLDGEFIRYYDSTADAYRLLGINKGNISKCCKGKYKSAGGFIWRFKE